MRQRNSADIAIVTAAVLLMVGGMLALSAVIWAGLTGHLPAPWLTAVGMWAPIAGFVLMLVEFGRMIAHRRSS